MIQTLRKTVSRCPECAREVEGAVVMRDGCVFLHRTCPDHGEYEFLLSRNGALYADFDRFYADVLKGKGQPTGKLTNYWVLSHYTCQMNCRYCSSRVPETEKADPPFETMSLEHFREIIRLHGRSKLTLSGGEPTIHPNVLDFFRLAAEAGTVTQLATNGVRLESADFCRQLKDAGVREVRLSVESFEEEQNASLGTAEFFPSRMAALQNLEALGIPTILSPTIFKGLNDGQLVACAEYAGEKRFIRELSVNGFSWVGSGARMPREHMIMPDEMMDVLVGRYGDGDREAAFTFQKVLFSLLRVLGMRLCLYTQIMVFIRTKGGLRPITSFLNMKRMKRGMAWWERFSASGRLAQGLALLAVLTGSLTARSLSLMPPCAVMLLANIFGIRIAKYPSRLLPVVLNTNCSTLNADAAVGVQCMSGVIRLANGALVSGTSSHELLDHEIPRRGASPCGDRARD